MGFHFWHYRSITKLRIIIKKQRILKFKEECSKTGTTEEAIAVGKIGFKTNLTAINPLDPEQRVPVYFANFVLMDYGFGAVFDAPRMIKETLISQKNII